MITICIDNNMKIKEKKIDSADEGLVHKMIYQKPSCEILILGSALKGQPIAGPDNVLGGTS